MQDTLHPLSNDSLVLVNAWERHAYVHTPSCASTIILALYIEPRWLGQIERQFSASAGPGFFRTPCANVTAQVRGDAERLASAMLVDNLSDTEETELLCDLMIGVIENYSRWSAHVRIPPLSAGTARDYRVRRATDYMYEHMHEVFDYCDVARAAGLSRSHLFLLFKENLGLTPNQYFSVLRMEKAFTSLVDREKSLGDISEKLGFSMQGHFTRFFRSNLGITPSNYRGTVNVLGHVQD